MASTENGGEPLRLRWLALLTAVVGHGVAIAAIVGAVTGPGAATLPTALAVSWQEETAPTPAQREPEPSRPRQPPRPRQPQEPLLQTAAAPAETPAAPAVEPAPPPAAAAKGTTETAPPIVLPRFNAAYLANPAPRYPDDARRRGEEGRVLLHVLVSASGEAQEVALRAGSGFERLDSAAMDAVRRWKFVPARQGGDTVAAWVLVPIQFTLRR